MSARLLVGLAAVTAAFAGGYSLPGRSVLNDAAVITGNGKAIDGDSVLVGSGKSVVDVRLYGLDAPEHDQTCKKKSGEDWPCGQEAMSELAKLVDGQAMRCEVIELEKTGGTAQSQNAFRAKSA